MWERDRQISQRGQIAERMERRKRQKGREGGGEEKDSGPKNINTDDYVDKRKVNRLRA